MKLAAILSGNIFLILLSILTAILCISCKEQIKEVTVKAKDIQIYGADSSYLKVVDSSYKLQYDEQFGKLHFRITTESVKKVLNPDQLYYECYIELIPLDKSGAPLTENYCGEFISESGPIDAHELMGNEAGTKTNLDFVESGIGGGTTQRNLLMNEIHSFKLQGVYLFDHSPERLIYNDSMILDKEKFIDLFEEKVNDIDTLCQQLKPGSIDEALYNKVEIKIQYIMKLQTLMKNQMNEFSEKQKIRLNEINLRYVNRLLDSAGNLHK